MQDQPHKIPVVMDSFNEEALQSLDDIRLQLQTQLEPGEFENLFLDNNGSGDGCNEFELDFNLQNITKADMENIKQQLRSFTNNVKERTLKNVLFKSEK